MTIIDRYLLRRLVAALAKTLLALVALYVFIDLVTHRDAAILRNEVPWHVVTRYYVALIPQIVFQVAPLSLLVSALLVLGDTAQHNEVTSALAGGISLRRFCRMPILVAGAFAVALFAMEETVGAAATREAERIESTYFTKRLDAIRGSLSWANLSTKWTCHIAKFNHLAHTGEGVFIHAIEPETLTQIEADRIYWDDEQGQWLLEDGRWMVFAAKADRRLENRRITQVPAPFTETPRELFALTEPAETKSAHRLSEDIAAATARGVPTNTLRVDYHAKFSQPAVSFVMIWLAIPFALRLRRGGLAISFGISILIAIAFLMVYSVCMTLGHAGRMPPTLAAWFANAVFLAVGIRLFVKTPT